MVITWKWKIKKNDINIKFLYYKLIYFAVPATAPQIDAHSAAQCSDTAGPATDPNILPKNESTVGPMLLLSDAVPLSPEDTSVNRQEQSYMRYKVLPVINIKL